LKWCILKEIPKTRLQEEVLVFAGKNGSPAEFAPFTKSTPIMSLAE
jgi:hypothetical protein